MIFDSGSLFGMPWETIAKAYRDRCGSKPHNELLGYAKDFFDFIISDGHLFPREYQEEQFISHMDDVVLRTCRVITPEEADIKDKDKSQIDELIKQKFGSFAVMVRGTPYIEGCDGDCAELETLAKAFKDRVLKSVEDTDLFKAVVPAIGWDTIFELAVTALMRKNWTTLPTTGLVFAGYGENQHFPHLHHFTCYGIVLGKLLCSPDNRNNVSTNHQNISEIIPLAQSEMVDTFICGASMSALEEIDKHFVQAIDEYTDAITASGNMNALDDPAIKIIDGLKENSKTKFQDLTTDYLSRQHTVPLRNVVGMLSIDELASLAETLISIESLKERVTRPTESVSGPIDVAVISKSDGFIWIQRKHYFDTKLNPSFVARRNLRLGDA